MIPKYEQQQQQQQQYQSQQVNLMVEYAIFQQIRLPNLFRFVDYQDREQLLIPELINKFIKSHQEQLPSIQFKYKKCSLSKEELMCQMIELIMANNQLDELQILIQYKVRFIYFFKLTNLSRGIQLIEKLSQLPVDLKSLEQSYCLKQISLLNTISSNFVADTIKLRNQQIQVTLPKKYKKELKSKTMTLQQYWQPIQSDLSVALQMLKLLKQDKHNVVKYLQKADVSNFYNQIKSIPNLRLLKNELEQLQAKKQNAKSINFLQKLCSIFWNQICLRKIIYIQFLEYLYIPSADNKKIKIGQSIVILEEFFNDERLADIHQNLSVEDFAKNYEIQHKLISYENLMDDETLICNTLKIFKQNLPQLDITLAPILHRHNIQSIIQHKVPDNSKLKEIVQDLVLMRTYHFKFQIHLKEFELAYDNSDKSNLKETITRINHLESIKRLLEYMIAKDYPFLLLIELIEFEEERKLSGFFIDFDESLMQSIQVNYHSFIYEILKEHNVIAENEQANLSSLKKLPKLRQNDKCQGTFEQILVLQMMEIINNQKEEYSTQLNKIMKQENVKCLLHRLSLYYQKCQDQYVRSKTSNLYKLLYKLYAWVSN